MTDWKPMTANKKRLREGIKILYKSLARDAQKTRASCLPKDWRNRVINGQ